MIGYMTMPINDYDFLTYNYHFREGKVNGRFRWFVIIHKKDSALSFSRSGWYDPYVGRFKFKESKNPLPQRLVENIRKAFETTGNAERKNFRSPTH